MLKPSQLVVHAPHVALHPEYLASAHLWTRSRDAVAGEATVKKKASLYLPPLPSHTTDANRYNAYLARATFFNVSSRTLEGLVGSVFRKMPVVNNPPVSPLIPLDELTQDGESIKELSRHLVSEVLLLGRVGILLDRPESDQGADDDRPYVAVYKAEDILNWRTVRKGRARILSQVVLREYVPSPITIGYDLVETIRVLELDQNGVYFQYKLTSSGAMDPESVVYPTNQGRLLTYIPFIFIGSESLKADVQKAPLSDIVAMNFSHYRSYAALEHGRAYTAFPQFYVSFDSNQNFPQFDLNNPPDGADPDSANADGAYRVDSDAVWEVEGGRPGILEYQGSGLNSLESALDKKEGQIQALGARLITPLKGLPAQSAIVFELQALGDAAMLMQVASQVSKAMNMVIRWLYEWQNILPPSPMTSFSFIASFTDTKITARELRAILALYKEHALPKDALYHTLREAGVLPPDMSLEDFSALLDDPEQLWQLDPRISV